MRANKKLQDELASLETPFQRRYKYTLIQFNESAVVTIPQYGHQDLEATSLARH
jgi:hypothetical protein